MGRMFRQTVYLDFTSMRNWLIVDLQYYWNVLIFMHGLVWKQTCLEPRLNG